MSTAKRFVVYCRVSTVEQGRSGLGIEAQRTACHAIAQGIGEIIGEFTEIESGDAAERPELRKALAMVRRTGATLLVAKLDRLGRDVELLAGAIKGRLLVADAAGASVLELHVRAIVAAEELAKIRQRTRDALQALKRRGVKLGSARPGHWQGREADRAKGQRRATRAAAAARETASAEWRAEILPRARELRASGLGFAAVADRLNAEGFRAVKGGELTAMQAARLLA